MKTGDGFLAPGLSIASRAQAMIRVNSSWVPIVRFRFAIVRRGSTSDDLVSRVKVEDAGGGHRVDPVCWTQTTETEPLLLPPHPAIY